MQLRTYVGISCAGRFVDNCQVAGPPTQVLEAACPGHARRFCSLVRGEPRGDGTDAHQAAVCAAEPCQPLVDTHLAQTPDTGRTEPDM